MEGQDNDRNVEDIMRMTMESIRKRKESGKCDTMDVYAIKFCGTFDAPGPQRTKSQIDLECLNSSCEIKNDSYAIRSHRGVIGIPLVKGRELIHGEVRRYVDPMIGDQNEFNSCVCRVLNQIADNVSAQIDERISQIETELSLKMDEKLSQSQIKLSSEIDEKLSQPQIKFSSEMGRRKNDGIHIEEIMHTLRENIKNEKTKGRMEDENGLILNEIANRIEEIYFGISTQIDEKMLQIYISFSSELDEKISQSQTKLCQEIEKQIRIATASLNQDKKHE